MPLQKTDTNLVWIDLEMTGLTPEKDVILEIATVITNDQLTILEEGPSFIIHQSEAALAVMGPWVQDIHTKSRLLEKVRASTTSLHEAAEQTLAFIRSYCEPQKSVLCGNSIWQDRAFLRIHMPEVESYLHYRIIDVSSVKELVRRWYPHNPHLRFKKDDVHRALPDIFASIEELRHYRTYFFIS